MTRRLRPGASEVFKLLVPCELVAEKSHEIFIRLRDDNRVTFEKLCDRKVAAAVDRLSGNLLSCYSTATLLARSILERIDSADIRVCESCAAYIAPGVRSRPHCPIQREHHILRTAAVAWWERIVRVGRVRRP